MTIDWIAKLRHLLQTVAFCLTVSALQVAFNPERSYGIPVTYSLAIGSITWLLIDFGRHFVPSSRETGWPQGAAGLMLPLVGIVTGYVGGTLVGDAVWGFSSWSEQARPRLVGSVLVTLLAGVIANFYFYSVNRGRYFERRMSEAQARATEARLKLLESQLEPHMLFNTLANLRVLIGMDPPRAQAMLDRLIAFLRSTLDASRGDATRWPAEFDRLADYLALMAVRMGPRLQVALDLPDELRQLPCRRCCCSRWSRIPSSMAWNPRSPAAASRSPRGVTARRLRLRVRDTGVGLAAASAPRHRASACSRCASAWRPVRRRGQLTLQAAPTDADGGTLAEVVLPLAPNRSLKDAHRPDRRRRTAAGCRRCRPSWPAVARARDRGQAGDGDSAVELALARRPAICFPRHPHARRAAGWTPPGAGRGLADRTAGPSLCWCSSPPTTSTRCRPSRRRRWTTWSSRSSATPGGLRGAAAGPAGGARRRRPRDWRPRWVSCARCSARSTGRPPRLEVIQAQVGALVHLVPVDEVVYFEAADKYVRVVTAEREHLIRLSLRELLPQLDPAALLAGAPRHGGAGALHHHRPARGVGQGHADAGRPARDAGRQPAVRAPVQGL
jgi:hypothetical protein